MSADTNTYESLLTTIIDEIADPLLVPNLGTNTAALMARYPGLPALHLWGGMGLTHSLGLGVALARPHRTVVVLDGDGSLLMGLSGLATIGVLRPPNLLHVVLDNAAWGNTGGQPTHTAAGVRLEDVAAACTYPIAVRAADPAAFGKAVQEFVADPQCTMILASLPYSDPGPAPRGPEPVLIKRDFLAECLRNPRT
jgi:thiamine pyrophosphate-dependent acetolactate synthase large subunit-like protein